MAIIGQLNGIVFEVPDRGQTEWADVMTLVFQIISAHNHDGNGNGATLGTASLANLSITTGKIADLAVTAAKLAADSVTTAKILNLNITTEKINDLAVTTAKLDNLSVTSGKLAADSVTTAKILDSNVTTAKILDANVTTAKIADSNITTAKVASDAIDDTKILLRNNQWLRGRNLANNTDINIVKVNAADEIELGASVTATPAVNSVGNTELQDNSVSQSKMQDNSVGTNEIINLSVITSKIENSNVTEEKIASDAYGTFIVTGSINIDFSLNTDNTLHRSEHLIINVTTSGNKTFTLPNTYPANRNARIITVINTSGGSLNVTLTQLDGRSITLATLANNSSRQVIVRNSGVSYALAASTISVGT